jgi:anti-sigma factor RsiW
MSDPRHHTTRLDAHLDRELEPREERDAAEHIEVCAACRDVVDTDALLGELLAEPLPEVTSAFVRATVSRATAARRPSAPLWWVSLPVSWRVGFAALLLLATLAGLRSGRPAPPAAHVAQELAWSVDSPEVAAMQVRPASQVEVPR